MELIHEDAPWTRRVAPGVALTTLGIFLTLLGWSSTSSEYIVEPDFTRLQEESNGARWKDFSDPSYLLEYAVKHDRFRSMEKLDTNGSKPFEGPGMEWLNNDTLLDDLFYPLNCDEFDDDSVYPTVNCTIGDKLMCTEHVEVVDAFNRSCRSACVGDVTWGVPCGWEAMSELTTTCAGNFSPIFPSDSKNNAPKSQYQKAYVKATETWYDPCNVHAFCYSCVEGGRVKDSCKAVITKYKTLYALSEFFTNLDSYWCDATILAEVENGTYI